MRFFRRRSGSVRSSPGSAGESRPASPTAAMPQHCPNCGSTELFSKKASFTAVYRIDDERSLSRPFTPLQVHCRNCDFLVNDDLHGDAVAVYAQLAEQAGTKTPQGQLAAQVTKAIREATRLPVLSDAQRQQDYDRVREAWGCAGMHPIPETELKDALIRILRGFFAEGAHAVEVETLDQGVLMLSFFTATGFRPVRLARANGEFVVYGQIQLYRILNAL